MSTDRGRAREDRFGFGDITATSVVDSTVLSPEPDADDGGARLRAVDADRRAAMVRVAEHAAEIGLDSAPALAAAAGIEFRPPAAIERAPRPAVGASQARAVTSRAGQVTRAGQVARAGQGRPVPTRQFGRQPARIPGAPPGRPAAPRRRRIPAPLVLVLVIVLVVILRAALR